MDRLADQFADNYETIVDNGSIRVRRVVLPEGLSLETANEASDLISRWEDTDRTNMDLVVDLYRLFNRLLISEPG